MTDSNSPGDGSNPGGSKPADGSASEAEKNASTSSNPGADAKPEGGAAAATTAVAGSKNEVGTAEPADKKPEAPAKKKVPQKGRKTPKAGKKPAADPAQVKRRSFVWWSIFAYIAALTLATMRFFFPRVLFEPKTRFKIGFPDDYAIGVDTKWQAAKRVWVVRDATKLYVILARCTHLGCTPDWKPSDNKFKCPCHGSGFTREGVNFEGPAPQPLFRVKVETDARGEIIVDKAVEFPFDHWSDADASIPV